MRGNRKHKQFIGVGEGNCMGQGEESELGRESLQTMTQSWHLWRKARRSSKAGRAADCDSHLTKSLPTELVALVQRTPVKEVPCWAEIARFSHPPTPSHGLQGGQEERGLGLKAEGQPESVMAGGYQLPILLDAECKFFLEGRSEQSAFIPAPRWNGGA